jgi:hypothetical protein
MVAGWLSDYKLTYDEDIVSDVTGEERKLTVKDFEENRGYVDENGFVHIFRKEPKDADMGIPWFTVTPDSDMNPVLKFNPYQSEELNNAFYIDRVADISLAAIKSAAENTEASIYDKAMLEEMMNASSTYKPVIKDKDDFLKKLIKLTILEEEADVHAYKKYMEHSYQISNLIQGLNGETKTNPFVFATWMGLLGCDFKITITDNGADPYHILEYPIEYDSSTNRLRVIGKDGEENVDKDAVFAVSAKQFS